jgi:predicted PurR-regulated permease PerM
MYELTQAAEAPPDPRRQATARVLVACVIVAAASWTIRSFLPGVAWACILAIATWPVYRRAEARAPQRWRRTLVPALVTTAIAAVFVVPFGWGVAHAVGDGRSVVGWVMHARSFGVAPPAWLGRLPFGSQQATDWWNDNLADPDDVQALTRSTRVDAALGYGRHLGALAARTGTTFAITILFLFFLYRDGASVAANLLAVARQWLGAHGEDLARQVTASIRGTLNGLVLVGLGEGCVIGIGYVVAGVPNAVLLGALTGVAATVPFGAPAVCTLAAALLYATGSASAALAILIFGWVVALTAEHTLRPALIGGATRLPFPLVLLGILGGLETFGLVGLFIGPAIMAALILIWRNPVGVD